jgi:pyruvate/2-oxoacid:ferredoxin oxidoreductase beta subunit
MQAGDRNINILVHDTELYSNTGGQRSKATQMAPMAKFAAGGKRVGKKDLAMQVSSYGKVYVARIAFGSIPQQTLLAMREYAYHELGYKVLTRTHPEDAEKLIELAQELVNLRWKHYEELATLQAGDFVPVA